MDNDKEQKYLQALKKASEKIKELLSSIDNMKQKELVAVVGMGCRFPGGANNPDAFWNMLNKGVDAVSMIPADRWDTSKFYDPDYQTPGKSYCRQGAFIDEVDKFDCGFFGISPPEAKSLDPQHRLLLEVSWEAFENAGFDITKLKGSRTGVFVGMDSFDYSKAHLGSGDPDKIDEYSATGIAFSAATGRLSYFYDFHGPCMTIDTACSSSLVALHLAISSLQTGESDMAMAGGVELILTPESYIAFSKINALAVDGPCRPFDDAADGYTKGEGCGIVVLKRFSDASRDGDNILAVFKGSAVNQDGESSGLTAPNAIAQMKVINMALDNAGLSPDDIDYIEAHGTGTRLGDPIEARALGMVFNGKRDKILIGSVKSNIGHLQAASGIASVIKVILAMQHERVPASLHFNKPSSYIPWDELQVEVCAKQQSWPGNGKPSTAGVSSFGFSGTNAHVILQSVKMLVTDKHCTEDVSSSQLQVLTFSAKNEKALLENLKNYRDYFSAHPDVDINDVCYTAGLGRTHFQNRLAVIGHGSVELENVLSGFLNGKTNNAVIQPLKSTEAYQSRRSGVVFLFTGQGAQYAGMGRALYEKYPVFKMAMDRCGDILKGHGVMLIDLLYGKDTDSDLVDQTTNAQPALFAIEYSIAELWKTWGVKPDMALGHSLGEYSAACAAGVFQLEDGLKLVSARGKLIHSLCRPGIMAAVFASYEKVSEIIPEGHGKVSIAAINAPENVVISGEEQNVMMLLAKLEQNGVKHSVIRVSHAFHSHLIEPMIDDYRKILSEITFSSPVIPLISNLTGKPVDAEQITTVDYWIRHLREPVRFNDSINHIVNDGNDLFLEIGPHVILSGLGSKCAPENTCIWASSLARGGDDIKEMLTALSTLYVNGVKIDWAGYYKSFNSNAKKIILPTYPFQRKRHWKDLVNFDNRSVENITSNMVGVDDKNCGIDVHSDSSDVKKSALGFSGTVKNSLDKKRAILSKLISTIQNIAGIDEVNIYDDLFKIGLSSIMITRLRQRIESDYDVEVEMKRFYNENNTVDKLAVYIEENSDIEPDVTPLPAHDQSVKEILHVMSQQLEALKDLPAYKTDELVLVTQSKKDSNVCSAISKPVDKNNEPAAKTASNEHEKVDLRSMKLIEDELNPVQREFVQKFIAVYTERTKKSKKLMETNRPVFSDWINSLGFRLSLKEIIYPIVSHSSKGARLWDIDGNEYVDMAIGYGVNYFGNTPAFVVEAVEKQLKEGYHLGPQFDLTGEAVNLICEMTGVERVTFCNSGTEAIMAALRIARTVTGRDKIVLFEGSFHGTFDGILALRSERGTIPAAPGTTQNMVDDVVLLKYGAAESLEFIKEHGRELAAVLVEPVQSRNPDFQPRAFIKQLRELTLKTKTALIFDEMITGFRLCPGGAQEFYGVKADIVTYGKVIGGGMPVGLTAGKAYFMDAIDGGMWNFGDASFPSKGVTFFGGTFCKHPLTVVAILAVLRHLKSNGPALQINVNQRTERFVSTMNAYFEVENVPLRIVHCASFFRFVSFGEYDVRLQPITIDLLFYMLLHKGVYTWERRICFFSTVHTDEDMDYIIQAIKQSIAEIREGGFPFRQLSATGNKAVNESYPLSEAQNQLLALNEINDNGTLAYNLTSAIRIQGCPDMERVCASLENVVTRHEALRTRIVGNSQEIVPFLKIDVPLIKVSGKNEVQEWFRNEGEISFDLNAPPLFRAFMLKITDGDHIFVFKIHHTIADGLSLINILNEWASFYNNGKEPLQLRSPMQYKEFLDRQTKYLDSEKMSKHESFWLGQLKGEIPTLNLPVDNPHPPVKSYKGGKQTFELNSEIYQGLCHLGKENSCSLFMTLMAVYSVFLHRLTGQEELLIGVPVSGRSIKGSDSLVGYCTHLLPIRSILAGEPRFTEHMKNMRDCLLEAYEHQDYPFSRLLNKLDLPGDARRPPLLSTIFNLDEAANFPDISDIKLSYYSEPVYYTHYDLIVNITEIEEKLVIDFIYNKDIFEVSTIKRLQEHLKTLVEGVLEDPDRLATRVSIIPDSEKNLLIDWNRTETEYPVDKTLVDLFQAQVEKTPDNIAVVFKGKQLTYRELNRKANQLAHYLLNLKVENNNGPLITNNCLVGICVERSLEMVIGLLGILKSGAAYVPLDPDYPAERLNFMLEDSRIPLLLTHDRCKGSINFYKGSVTCLDNEWEHIAACSSENPLRKSTPEDLAYVIYTSGSTGKPKGVMNTHRGIFNRIVWMQNEYQLNDADRVLQKTPFSFDVSLWEFFWPLITGSRLVVAKPGGHKDPAYLVELIAEEKITTVHFVPSMFRAFLSVSGLENCSALRQVVCSGEALTPDIVDQYFNHFENKSLHNLYGPTEAAVDVAFWPCKRQSQNIPIGKPLANTQLYVLDKYLQPVPIGITGELHIGGVQIARGYLNRPELTEEKFIEVDIFGKRKRLYKTGDLARWRFDGNLDYLGRIDYQVKLRGFRIELGEIETTLLKHETIGEAVVMLIGDDGSQSLAAYVTLSKAEFEVTEFRDWLKSKLPEYMIPASFTVMERFPLTTNGKVNRNELPPPDSQTFLGDCETPRTDIEKQLVEVWGDVLKQQDVGINSNFFALGGDSIKAILIVSRLNQNGINLNVGQLFDNQTISQLASSVSGIRRIASQAAVTGDVLLTAIHAEFFRNHMVHKHHYSLGVLIRASGNLEEQFMSDVFKQILKHHDALRMQYCFQGDLILQENKDVGDIEVLETVDLRGKEDEESGFKEHSARISGSIDLAQGPLMKAVLYKMSANDRLLVVIHHLVVDGISWRILIDDITRAYDQRMQGKKIELPSKTDSFKLWAEKIHEYSNSDSLLEEKIYWKKLESTSVKMLPTDWPSTTNRYKERNTLYCSLTKDFVDSLLKNVNRAYNTEINDILLTALTRAMYRLYGEKTILLNLEGHGREVPQASTLALEDQGGSIDVTRTTGWFTSIYPVILTLPDAEDIGLHVKHIKETLRKIPNKGFGYGILKYITAPENKKDITFQISPRISFNYLGSFDEKINSEFFNEAHEFIKNTIHPELKSIHDMDIEGKIIGGILELAVSYNTNTYKTQTIEKLLQTYRNEIQLIIDYCMEIKAAELTPSDLTYNMLSLSELDLLVSDYGVEKKDLKDIYSLSPMQEGMMFHSVYDTGSESFFEQFSFSIHGELNVDLFKVCWNKLFKRYDILRTIFVHKGLERPLQIVVSERQIDFAYEDISSFQEDKQKARIEEFETENRKIGFDLSRDVLMRIQAFKLDEDSYTIVWSFHHIILDGWSAGIIIKELFQTYEAVKNGIVSGLKPVARYSRYIEWLDKVNKEKARNYWAHYVSGYDHVATLCKDKGKNVSDPAYLMKTLDYKLSEGMTSELRNLAIKYHVSINSIIQSAWGLLLCKYSNVDDVVFGSVVSGRPAGLREVENMVGLFLNTIPVRIITNQDESFYDLIKRVQKNAMESEPYHYYPLAEVQALSNLQQELIGTVVVFENYPFSEEMKKIDELFDLGFSIGLLHEFEQNNYNCTLEVYPGKEFLFELNYNGSVYSEILMIQVKDHFARILDAVIQKPDIQFRYIKDLLLSEKERKERDTFLNLTSEIHEDF
ncbi:MAG: amino acid adenylation domain-containing protein [Candidatus Anammoxibacter sp.]